MEERRTSAKGFLLGLLAGGAAGSIAALLYAPKSGKELRRDISKKSREVIKDTEHYMGNVKNRAAEIITDGKKKTENLILDARNKAGNIAKSTEKLYVQGKDFISDEAARIKEAVKAGVDTFNEERRK